MKVLQIICAVLLPPLAVFLKKGIGGSFLIAILLTLIAWIPGVVYALWVVLQGE